MALETKICQSCKANFPIEPDDFAFYEQMHVPPPTWCPQCRMTRRMAWFGYRILYKRDGMITFWHPDSGHEIYDQKKWHSDAWDPKSYGRDYDFSRSFFDQWRELFMAVPKPALQTQYSTMINSEYCNGASDCKNCYLCFKFDRAEECGYCNSCSYLKNCFDVSWSNHAELCYACVNLERCYQVFFSQDCSDCHDVWYSRDLVGCSNCYGCINLRNKNYCIFNEQYSKEEYEKKIKEFDSSKIEAFFLTQPRRQFHGYKNQDISGDYIYTSKNTKDSYMVRNSENLRYCQLLKAGDVHNAMDYTTFGLNAEWIYECGWVGIQVNNVKFSIWCYKSHDLEYCFGCMGSGNLFGCVGIRTGEYCILNKQYSKDEYIALVEKIKASMKEYGEMLPISLCPWPYNESNADEWFPLTKDQALAQGFAWRDEDVREYKPASTQVPDHIKAIDENILKEILKCDACGRNYQIIGKELQFLKRFNLPIPRHCPLCRDRARIKQLNPIEIYDRSCAKCKKDIQTSYAPERPEIVYCESCYQQEVM